MCFALHLPAFNCEKILRNWISGLWWAEQPDAGSPSNFLLLFRFVVVCLKLGESLQEVKGDKSGADGDKKDKKMRGEKRKKSAVSRKRSPDKARRQLQRLVKYEIMATMVMTNTLKDCVCLKNVFEQISKYNCTNFKMYLKNCACTQRNVACISSQFQNWEIMSTLEVFLSEIV